MPLLDEKALVKKLGAGLQAAQAKAEKAVVSANRPAIRHAAPEAADLGFPHNPHWTAAQRDAAMAARWAEESAEVEGPCVNKSPLAIPTAADFATIQKFAADIKDLPGEQAIKRRSDVLAKITSLYPELATHLSCEPVREWSGVCALWQAAHVPLDARPLI